MLCTECPKYSTCTDLCNDAEEYVSQDYVGQGKSGVFIQPRDMDTDNRDGNSWLEIMQRHSIKIPAARFDMEDFEELSRLNFSNKQLTTILRYYVFGENGAEIARDEGVTRQAIFKRLKSSVSVILNALERVDRWNDDVSPNIDRLEGDEYQKHRVVLFLYLYERLERWDIALRLGLSFSYVCKLLNVALEIIDENVD